MERLFYFIVLNVKFYVLSKNKRIVFGEYLLKT